MSDYNDGLIPEPCLRLNYGFGQQYASVELGDGTGYVRVTDDLRSEYHKMKRWYDDVLKDEMDSNDELRMRNASLEAALEGMHLIREQDKAENAELRELVADFDKCLDTALYLAGEAGYLTMPDQKLFASLRPRMRELGVEVD